MGRASSNRRIVIKIQCFPEAEAGTVRAPNEIYDNEIEISLLEAAKISKHVGVQVCLIDSLRVVIVAVSTLQRYHAPSLESCFSISRRRNHDHSKTKYEAARR